MQQHTMTSLVPDKMAEESDSTRVQGLPAFMTKSSLEAYGWRVLVVPGEDNPLIQLERTRKFHIRDDDVLLAAYPKCGTHWLWEVTHMLLHQTTEHEKRSKAQVMLESPGGLERADKEPSPRILNSHNVIAHLPQEVIAKKTKVRFLDGCIAERQLSGLIGKG
uniref:Sulfotransferase domain-containing protein n=1 Tax=Biomphalaria glabrata TaxID=6526 RepID=A0A2C9LCR3_BIOGL